MSITRYDLLGDEMQEAEDGVYVQFADHEAAVDAAVAAERKRIDERLTVIRVECSTFTDAFDRIGDLHDELGGKDEEDDDEAKATE